VAAAVFAGVSLVLSPRLLLETSWALGSVWALLLWIVAGLAVTGRRPRWGIAGAALGLAALARLETFLVIGLALAVLAVLRFGPARWRRPLPAGTWRISIGLLALPVMCLHDLLLTGDPFFWTSVAASYSATAESAGRLPDLTAVARDLADLVAGQVAVTVLAVIGVVVLAVRARWSILVGVLALGPGMAAFLLVLAARHTFVDPRYLVPISVALIFAAAVGLSAVRVPDLAPLVGRVRSLGVWSARDRSIASLATVSLVAAALAIAFAPAIGPLDRATRVTIASARHVARTADRAMPRIRTALADPAGAGSGSGAAAGGTGTPAALIVVPVAIRPRVAVELKAGAQSLVEDRQRGVDERNGMTGGEDEPVLEPQPGLTQVPAHGAREEGGEEQVDLGARAARVPGLPVVDRQVEALIDEILEHLPLFEMLLGFRPQIVNPRPLRS